MSHRDTCTTQHVEDMPQNEEEMDNKDFISPEQDQRYEDSINRFLEENTHITREDLEKSSKGPLTKERMKNLAMMYSNLLDIEIADIKRKLSELKCSKHLNLDL